MKIYAPQVVLLLLAFTSVPLWAAESPLSSGPPKDASIVTQKNMAAPLVPESDVKRVDFGAALGECFRSDFIPAVLTTASPNEGGFSGRWE
jgi:hypothetical protein